MRNPVPLHLLIHLQNNTRDASICISGLVLSNPAGSGEHTSMEFLSVLLLGRSTRQFYFHTHLSSNKLSLFFRSIIHSLWLLFVSFDLVAFCHILKHYIIVVLNLNCLAALQAVWTVLEMTILICTQGW